MKQTIKKGRKNGNKSLINKKKRKPRDSKGKVIKEHPKFGTSKLEQDFARNFLDKMNVNYIWQFEAKDIKRSYDFYLPDSNLLIEVDGDYWHANPKKYDVNNWYSLTPTQKKDIRVDELKNKWALLHCIPLLRIWEDDIRKNPDKVWKKLNEMVKIHKKGQILIENKNKRHNNKIK